MNLSNLTEEQKKRIAECKSADDYKALAKELGYELTDDQLDKINGGEQDAGWQPSNSCPSCGSTDVDCRYDTTREVFVHHCNTCGYEWETK